MEYSDDSTASSSGAEWDNMEVTSSSPYETCEHCQSGPDSVTVYSNVDLMNTVSCEQQERILCDGGICTGLSLAWLQRVVCDQVAPERSWPDVAYAYEVQQYSERNRVAFAQFPKLGYMSNQGLERFYNADEGLRYLWHNSGSYILIIYPRVFPGDFQRSPIKIGHAIAYSDKTAWPRGYLMNPNTGNHCIYTFRGLIQVFRTDGFITECENSKRGLVLSIIRVAELEGDVPVSCSDLTDTAGENSDDYVRLTGMGELFVIQDDDEQNLSDSGLQES